MPTFPFARAKPLGWALYEVLTSSQMTSIDETAAQAADGLVWTDVGQFRNWLGPQTVNSAGLALLYNSTEDVWWSVGVNAGDPRVAYLVGGGGVFQGGPAPGTSLTVRKRAAAHRPVSNRMVFGGLPGASSNRKYLVGDPGGFSTLTAASSQTNTTAVGCLAYVSTLDLFVSGHEGTGVVETSTDGAVWTSRTVPNANARSCIAWGSGPSNPGIVITSSVSTNKAIRSLDGINWAECTLPSAQVWNNVVWVPLLGKFVAIAEAFAAVAVSTDGITWTSQPFTLPTNIGTLNSQDGTAVAFGRNVWVMASRAFGSGSTVGLYSQDGGATWRYGANFANSIPTGPLATNGRQMLYAYGTALSMSIATGF